MKPETRFRQNKVLPFLRKLKDTWYEPIQQIAINGSPDFVLCMGGQFVALELKKDAKTLPSALQSFKLAEVRRTGGVAIVASPDNWDEVKKQLSEMDQKRGSHGNATS